MKAIVLSKCGSPDVLQISEVPDPHPTANELLVKIHYSGVNYADLLSRQCRYSWAPKLPYILGLEASGEVIEKGKDVRNFEVGDRVILGVQSGGYAQYITIQESLALPMPNHFNFQEGASFLATYFTAWIAMTEMARVREKEVMLVHSGAGGVGTAAIQLGNALGLDVHATTGSEHKRQKIKNLGAEPYSYDDFDQKMPVKPNFILETMGGDVFKRSMKILAPMGRLVSIGATGIQYSKKNPISLFKAWRAIPRVSFRDLLRNSKGFMGLHVGYLRKYPEIIRPAWEKLKALVEEKDIHPVIHKVFPLSDASKAHSFIHARKNIGKVILDPWK